ncbi:hypothetical protein AC1031_005279 [Aphanomyces cochlioides]|nr:hypothetical protein AC1031_005279 [Aphanomyces cochlioides]
MAPAWSIVSLLLLDSATTQPHATDSALIVCAQAIALANHWEDLVKPEWCPSAPAPTTDTPAPTTKSPPTPTPTSRPTPTSATPAPTPRTTSSTSTTASSPESNGATSEGSSSNASIGSMTSNNSSKRDNNTLIIVLTITGGVVVIAIVVGVVIVKRRHRVELPVTLPRQSAPYVQDFMDPKHPSASKKMKTTVTVTATTSSSDDANSNHWRSQQLNMGELEMYKIPPSDISIIKTIASGAYGEVLLAQLHGESVAVKRLM